VSGRAHLPSSTLIHTCRRRASYAYDADGRRVKQTVGTAVTNYLWDEQSPYGDVVAETDGSGAIQASYVLGGSELLAQVRGSVAGATASYPLPDGQGSVRALANSAGTITDTYRYDAYGNQTSSSGTTPNPYRYAGQRLDDGTGLYQLRARSYDPGSGRFLSRDTAAVGLSDPAQLDRYVYVRDDPVDAFDPSGHDALQEYGDILEGDQPFVYGGNALEVGKSLALTYIRAVLYEGLDAEDAAVVFDWVVNALDILQFEADIAPGIRILIELVHAAHGAGGSGGSGTAPGAGGTLPGGGTGSSGGSGGGASGSGVSGGTRFVAIVILHRTAHPQSTQHIDDARTLLHKPSILTKASAGRTQRRQQCLASANLPPRAPVYQRDEYPPAISLEGGAGCDVRYVLAPDNEGAGTSMGNQLRPYPEARSSISCWCHSHAGRQSRMAAADNHWDPAAAMRQHWQWRPVEDTARRRASRLWITLARTCSSINHAVCTLCRQTIGAGLYRRIGTGQYSAVDRECQASYHLPLPPECNTIGRTAGPASSQSATR
jgi:RHS repeat-associated protein